METKNPFADRLKRIRESLGQKKNEFADQLGIQPGTYYKIEQGVINPSLELIDTLVRKFNVNLYYFHFGKEPIFGESKQEATISDLVDESKLPTDDVESFFKCFRHSEYLQYMLVAEFKQLMVEKRERIERELNLSMEKKKNP